MACPIKFLHSGILYCMKNVSKIVVVGILLTSLGLMIATSLQESGTQDELAHIPSGYAYVTELDYRLNPEHPPLVKILAGLPLTFLDLNFPTDNKAWTTDVNGQWDMGSAFLYESGNDADQIIQLSRIGPMLITLVLIIFVYIWSREIMGEKWALLPTFITALSPTFLSHGHYVTTDMGAALGIFIATYYFVRYLNHPSRKSMIFAGIAFGVAMLMKFSTILLVPLFLIVIFIYWLVNSKKHWTSIEGNKLWHVIIKGLKLLRSLTYIFIIGFIVLLPFYMLVTTNYPPERQLSDTEFILSSFAEGPPLEGEACNFKRCFAELDIWAADKPVARAYGHYFLGILMVLQRSAGGNTAYFLGKVSNLGSRLYFPAVYSMKEPLPILLLISLGSLFGLYKVGSAIAKKRNNFTEYFGTHLAEFTMLLFISIYAAWSINSPLNIGVRHLMPIMPFMYILTVTSVKKWVQSGMFKKQIKLGVVYALTAWFAVDVALAYPFYLSYFNEFVGTDNGWQQVTDSNYDWGQDLKRLATYVDENNIDVIAIDYFGAGSPEYYMGNKAIRWWSAKGSPTEDGIKWFAVSINNLQGSIAPKIETLNRPERDEYSWLENPYEPTAVAGTSLFIYKLD